MATTTERPTVEMASDVGGKIVSDNARSVGYEEYVEALDLEISDKEVSTSFINQSQSEQDTC